MESLIENGWNYISAIFQVLLNKSKEKSLIEPQYIFRGITKRWFSTSTLIDNNIKTIIKDIEFIANNNDKRNTICEPCEKWIQRHTTKTQKRSNKNAEPNAYYFKLNKEKIESKDYYEFLYERLKDSIDNLMKKDTKAFDLLNTIMAPEAQSDYNYCVPQFINSGAVVRLKKGSLHPSNLDYVNYIKHMLNDIKVRFPEYNGDSYSDIEILADMQHKGGATCLADFSTNFLTALWFATQALDDDIGYLFCYDINRALIQDDKLYILNKNYEHRRIEDLLYETTKKTKFSIKKSYRFWLWRPSNLNERIAMQDSVFIFGLEPFDIKENNVIAIPIPHSWKKPIQHVLKSFFGITAESVYCDVEGYADANSKTRPYTRSVMHFFNENFGLNLNEKYNKSDKSFEHLQCGIDCLFQGEYKLALRYFSLYEAKTSKKYTKDNFLKKNPKSRKAKLKEYTLNTDVLYSKGICLKHLGDSYGAIHDFSEAYKTCKVLYQYVNDILSKAKSPEEIKGLKACKDYIISKQEKAFNDLLDMYFITHQYEQAAHLISERSSDYLDIICSFKIKEAKCCKAIENYLYFLKMYNNTSTAISHYLAFLEKAKSSTTDEIYSPLELTKISDIEIEKEDQPFLYVLNSFFDSIYNYFTHFTIITRSNGALESEKKEYYFEKSNFEKFNNAEKEIDDSTINNIFKNDNDDKLFTGWDLRNIDILIEEISITLLDYSFLELKYQIDKMKNFINFVQGKINLAKS